VCVCAGVVFHVSCWYTSVSLFTFWLDCVDCPPNNLALLDEFDFAEVLTRAQMLRYIDSISLFTLYFKCLASDEPIRGTLE